MPGGGAAPSSEFVAKLLELSPEERAGFIATLPRKLRARMRYLWGLWARPEQVWRPTEHTYTVALAGRGFGKTRMGAETCVQVARQPELCDGWMGIAGRTWGDVYGTMIEGDVGILACSPPGFRPRVNERKRQLVWPNGVRARLFSGEEPASFRGPNIGWLWADELAHWSRLSDSWQTCKMVLRKGQHPRALITTTPLALPEIERLIWEFTEHDEPMLATPDTPADRVLDGFVVARAARIVEGSTYDNAMNLAANFLTDVVATFEGTPLADQELRGKVFRGTPASPFRFQWFRRLETLVEDLVSLAIVIDPAAKATGRGSEVGIMVMGASAAGRVYLLADLSGTYTPPEWASVVSRALAAYDCTTIVAEDNQGGDMVEVTLRSEMPADMAAIASIQRVHATRSKAERAALAAPLWSSGRCYHVGPARRFVQLERQMVSFDPRKPPGSQPTDRMDAVVWGALWFAGDGTDAVAVKSLSDPEAWDKVLEAMRAASGE